MASILTLRKTNTPQTPATGDYSIFVDTFDGHLKGKKETGVVVDLEAGGTGPCSSCFTCNDVASCVATNSDVWTALAQAVTDSTDVQNAILAIPGIGGGLTIYDEGTSIQAGVTKINFVGSGISAVWNSGTGRVDVTVTGGGGTFTCADVKTCLESSITDLDLSNLSTLKLGGAITYGLGTTMDWTNTTQSGETTFDSGYIANYSDGSTINQDGDVNYGSTSIQTYENGSLVTGEVAQTDLTVTNTNVLTTNDATTTTINNGSTTTNNGVTINNVQITENYTDTPNQISCEGSPLFATPFTPAVATQYVETQITFDNGVNTPDIKVIKSIVGGVDMTTNFVCGSDTGSVETTRSAGDVTFTILTGTVGYFTINSICRYNEVSQNNYTNKIHNNNGDIFNQTDVTQNIGGASEINYGGNTTVNLGGTTNVENLVVKNITFENGGGLMTTAFKSSLLGPYTGSSGSVITVTHNLGVSQADIETGRYTVLCAVNNGQGFGTVREGYFTGVAGGITPEFDSWSSGNPSNLGYITWQANTMKIFVYPTVGESLTGYVIIRQNW